MYCMAPRAQSPAQTKLRSNGQFVCLLEPTNTPPLLLSATGAFIYRTGYKAVIIPATIIQIAKTAFK